MTRILSLCIFFVLLCPAFPSVWAGENAWHKIALDKIHVISFTSDPVRPSTLYAVTSIGLQKSVDSGATWTALGEILPRDNFPNSVAVNYMNSKELYVGYDGAGIFKSSDGGNTWQAINEGLPNLNVRCIVISPKDPNLLYIGIQNGVAISTSGGKLWHMSSGFKRAVNVNAIVIDPKNPQYLFAATGGAGVFKSGNGGVSWIDINNGLSSLSIMALHIDAENPDLVLAAAYHPATPSDLYVGKANGGAFRTQDGGRTWQETSLMTTTVFSFAADAKYPGAIYAGAWGGAYRSVDKGVTWVDINTGLDNAFMHKMHVLPERPPVLLAGTTYGLLSYTDTELEKLLGKDDGLSLFVRYAIAGGALVALILLFLVWRKKRRNQQDSKRAIW